MNSKFIIWFLSFGISVGLMITFIAIIPGELSFQYKVKLSLICAVLGAILSTVIALIFKVKPSSSDSNSNNSENNKLVSLLTEADLETVDKLLQDNINIDCLNSDGDTSLILAAKNGDLNRVKWLINNGADPFIENNIWKTARYYAESRKYGEIEQLLTEREKEIRSIQEKNRLDFDALYQSIRNNNKDNLLQLINKNQVDINAQDENGNSALFLCIESDNEELFKLLVENGADITHKNNSGQSVYKSAIKNKSGKIKQIIDEISTVNEIASYKASLEKGIDINYQNDFGDTFLILATEKGNENAVLWLLDKGANPLIKNSSSQTARYFAKTRGFNSIENILKLAEEEILAEIELERKNKSNVFSNFENAIMNNDENMLDDLLNKHTANFENNEKETPLFLCVKYDKDQLFMKLLKLGANIDITNADGANVEDVAKTYNSTNVKSLISEINRKKVENGILISEKVKNRDKDSIRELLHNGADINSPNQLGDTPLIVAAEMGFKDMVEFLLELGADKSITNSTGYNAKYFAETRGHNEVSSIL